MAVNFSKNQQETTSAWQEVLDSKDSERWALFGYEGTTNDIILMSTGSEGLDELTREFNSSMIQYAFCRVIDREKGVNKLILINWQGDSSPLSRKGLCASHVGDVSNYFKCTSMTITLRNDDEATKEYIMEQVLKSSSSRVNITSQNTANDTNSKLSPAYKKTEVSSQIAVDRKSFWQRQEEEEKERLAEEKRRAVEKQALFEKERKLREESEAKKLAETIRERDRIIEATRQAESLSSQPSSIMSTNATDDNDDGRVGRRSELIRLERNQETQSLISKGLIKNKRAIFEKASQQSQSQLSSGTSMPRRPSGSIITQRLNAFQSLDVNGGSSTVDKLSNGLAKQVDLNRDSTEKQSNVVKKEVECVKITKEEPDLPRSDSVSTIEAKNESPDICLDKPEHVQPDSSENIAKNEEDTGKVNNSDLNGNDKLSPKKDKKTNPDSVAPTRNGKSGIKAKALYDYEASDHTEISFDPEDLIGSIDKVDPGWWHGSVLTGRFKGQTGLFPSNYVEEIH